MVGWHLLSYDIVYFNILYFNTLSICAHVCVYVTYLADAFILENLERKKLRNFLINELKLRRQVDIFQHL